MSISIIDLIKGQLGPALVTQAAAQLGESESGISKAMNGLLPTIIGGLANNSGNPAVLDAISNASSHGILGNLLNGSSSNNSWITDVLPLLFGSHLNQLINTIASFAGISNNSSSSLFNLVTGATLGSIGKYAKDNNLDKSGISGLLDDQKSIASTLLPAGLSLDSLNMGDWAKGYKLENDPVQPTPHGEPKIEGTTPTGNYPVKNENGGSIWKWLLPLLLLLSAGYFLWKQCEKKETTTTTIVSNSTTMPTDTAATNTGASGAKVDENIDLNGKAIKGYKGGMEDQMIAFLKSGGYKNATDDNALKNTWYNFDHINFKIGSSTELEAGSEGQLQNLVTILKAYPEAKVKIGGYTDKTGDETKNLKLSANRANFIKGWLNKQGVGSQVAGADGYGSKFAKIDAKASDAERAIDRKMSVRFAK